LHLIGYTWKNVITLLAPKMNLHRHGNMKLCETVKE
jgi:hypothetical protein